MTCRSEHFIGENVLTKSVINYCNHTKITKWKHILTRVTVYHLVCEFEKKGIVADRKSSSRYNVAMVENIASSNL